MVVENFFFVYWGGVRLSLLGTSATNWPIVPAPVDRWCVRSSRWNENWQRKPKYSEKTFPTATLSTTNPTWPDLGSNPGRLGGKPATNRLSYGMVPRNVVNQKAQRCIILSVVFNRESHEVKCKASLKRSDRCFIWGYYTAFFFVITHCSPPNTYTLHLQGQRVSQTRRQGAELRLMAEDGTVRNESRHCLFPDNIKAKSRKQQLCFCQAVLEQTVAVSRNMALTLEQ
jgi:hypothetical protein